MSHVAHEVLWAAAEVPLEGDDYAHLQLCPDCRLELENIKAARAALFETPAEPPQLSDAAARRIGGALKKAAEREARRQSWWGAWWPFGFGPTWALAPVAAALLAFVAYRITVPEPAEAVPAPVAAKSDDVSPLPPVVPTQPGEPKVAPQPPPKKVFASVKATRKAKSGTAAVKKSQELGEGDTVTTARGGVLSMTLPDGSSMRLAGGSQLQLTKLEEREVTLDVQKGSLQVVARHDASRELRVRAGDVEVVDVGTKFTVSREDPSQTLVWVEEGEVQVNAGGESLPAHAGQAVQWRNGKLRRQQWASSDEVRPARPPPAVAVAVAANAPTVDETPPIPAEGEKVSTPPPPAEVRAPAAAQDEPQTASKLDEWSTPSNLKDAPVNTPPPVPAPEPPPSPAAAAEQAPQATPSMPQASEEEENVSFLSKVDKMRQKIHGMFQAPSRLARADEVARLASASQCTDAIRAADSWLMEPVPKGESFNLRRSVLQSKLRCLQYQGRTGDAAAVQRELEKL